MNKSELFEFFDQKISKTAIRDVDDEWRVVGKYCYAFVYEDGLIDIWLCSPAEIASGLGTRALKNRISALESLVESPIIELTGEAYTQTRVKDAVLSNLQLLGIRRARQISDEQRQVTAMRLQRYRESCQ